MVSIASTAVVADDVVLGADVVIEDFVRIGLGGSGPPTEIGERSVIRAGTIIYSGVVVGRGLQTGHHVVIRSESELGEDVVVGTHSVLDGQVRIGNHVSIQSNVYIPPGSSIDDHSFLGPCCVLTNDRAMGSYARGIVPRGNPLPGPTIGRAVRLGANCTVLPGVVVGDEAVIGAGAVVTEDVAPMSVSVGVPARHIGDVPEDQIHPQRRS